MASQPNVATKEAADFIRSRVYRFRDEPEFIPDDIVGRMLSAGHGKEFDGKVRRRRLRRWVLQVFRRLRRHGWLLRRNNLSWLPTEALRGCSREELLARKARRVRHATPPQPPDSWEQYIQDWVFDHREASFATDDVVLAVVQRGFAAGRPEEGPAEARSLVEGQLEFLEEECLLDGAGGAGNWRPTELLRSWPAG